MGGVQEIPFHEVKDINLKDVTGIHCIELGISHGRRNIYFKSSLWYPFNYKKVDGQVNQLFQKIQESKNVFLNSAQKGIGSPTINIT